MSVVLALAVGIGIGTTLASVLKSTFWGTLPFRDPERIVVIREKVGQLANIQPSLPANARHFETWRKHATAFDAIVAFRPFTTYYLGASPSRLNGLRVSSDFFSALGIPLRLGRSFTPEEEQLGHDEEVIITEPLWRSLFQSDPDVIGKTISLDTGSLTIVGVLSNKFAFPKGDELGTLLSLEPRIDIFKPLGLTERERSLMGDFRFGVLGVLKQDSTISQAVADLDHLQTAIAADMPERFDLSCSVTPLNEEVVRGVRPSLILLTGTVLILMIILFVNLSTLILAKTIVRTGELALARALGAPSHTLWGGLICEASLLATVGGIAGLGIAAVMCQVLRRDAQMLLPHAAGIRLDWTLGILGVISAIVVAAAASIYPAFRATVVDPQVLLKGSERSTTGDRNSRRVGSILIALQVALSSSLVLVAGIMAFGAYALLNHSDPGFATRDRVGIEVELPPRLYASQERRVAFIESSLIGIKAIPGVAAAAMISTMPFRGQGDANIISTDKDTVPLPQRPIAYERIVSPDYFKTLAIPLRAGRLIDDKDRSRPVVLISESLARRLWRSNNPIDRRIHLGDVDRPGYDVTGVVGDVKLAGFDKPAPFIVYIPYWLVAPNKFAFVINTRLNTSVLPSVRRKLSEHESQAVLSFADTLMGVLQQYYVQIRVVSLILVVFSIGSATLVLIGIYGTTAYWTEQRHRELAIREALGETVSALQARVLRQGLMPLSVGLGTGYAFGAAGVIFVRSHFYSGLELNFWFALLTGLLFVCPTILSAYFLRRYLHLVPVASRLRT